MTPQDNLSPPPRIRKHIMLVDDERFMLSALKRLIRVFPCQHGNIQYQLELEAFDTPDAALSRARQQMFDLVITDYRMPGMNGIEFLTTLRQIQPDMGRILLTSAIEPAVTVTPPVNAGIDRFLAKPCSEGDLLHTIADVLYHNSQRSSQTTGAAES
jgi:two-component system probable response regulator PhcQ